MFENTISMIIVLLLLNLYVKMSRNEHSMFLDEIDELWSCGCWIMNGFMFNCCCWWYESCCCWIDTLGIINCELVMGMVMLLLKMVVVKIGFDYRRKLVVLRKWIFKGLYNLFKCHETCEFDVLEPRVMPRITFDIEGFQTFDFGAKMA